MPIYVFRCDCGRRFERLVRRDADPPSCPACGGATRKIPAGPSLGRRSSGRDAAPPADGLAPPWQAMKGNPEKLRREVEFRRNLAASAVTESHGGPERDAGPGPSETT